ncbi:hypothetical protein N7492_002723 [Penicillium capsulatum]|uniref:Cytochrome P450 n=1 Tax=Penicillium capsulatum TaxID=69766 RepID=A0A9W9LVG7_9EURO|nr:hypothetical protein N7492_002723 [Penicillium capsulatum]KAJ6122680.1 hypothetical protein N7512_005145 [Penicillium capsulatum]
MAIIHITVTLGVVAATAIGYGLACGYQHRSKINQLRKQGIAMPKWNWWTGHLLVLQKYTDRLPPDANVQLAMEELALEYGDTEVFLMDFWPVYPPFFIVYDPQAAMQVSTKLVLPKLPLHLKFMLPIVGGPNLHSMNGQEWKTWRSMFNPGFSAARMTDLLPAVIDSVQVFCDILRENVDSGIVHLDDLTTRLTMDIILKVTLDMNSGHQRSEHPIAHALHTITAWHSFWDPRVLMNPLRPFIQKYYGNVMNHCIQAELQQRFAEMIQDKSESKPKRAKSVIALALEAYLADPQLSKNVGDPNKLDEHFAKYASYQIRLFLFAGNDTTSSSIVYVYHLLSKYPEVLRQVREEHDRVFGTDPSAASKRLKDEPTLLSQCPLTLAVIKETLRLFPPASTTRGGRSNASLTDRHGNVYPLDYVGANILHPAAHHNPRVWPRVDEFLPERFLVSAGHELYPDPGAWRPFEQGPRSCIGQTLVYNEMQVVLVMTARVFNISPAYDEWDRLNPPTRLLRRLSQWTGLSKPGPRTVKGERAYQTEKAGTHPADGYPCRVALVA